MDKFTQGPWEVAGQFVRTKRTDIDGRGLFVADVSFNIHPAEEHRGNAALIAAAPALLAVARLAQAMDDEWKCLSLDERSRLDDAIAQATGVEA